MSAIPALRENTTKSQKRAATKLSTEPPLKKSRITPPTESNKSTLSGQTQLDETDDALGRVVNLLGFDDIVTKARNTLDNLIERCEDGTSRRYELANLQYTLNRIHSNLASIPADLPNLIVNSPGQTFDKPRAPFQSYEIPAKSLKAQSSIASLVDENMHDASSRIPLSQRSSQMGSSPERSIKAPKSVPVPETAGDVADTAEETPLGSDANDDDESDEGDGDGDDDGDPSKVVFTPHLCRLLLEGVVKYKPYTAKYGSKGRLWDAIATEIQKRGGVEDGAAILRHTIIYKTQALIAPGPRNTLLQKTKKSLSSAEWTTFSALVEEAREQARTRSTTKRTMLGNNK